MHFIGENSQYAPHSAFLKSNELADFNAQAGEFSKNKLKVTPTQSLQNSVQIAYRYHQGDLSFLDITKINENLSAKPANGAPSPKKLCPVKTKPPQMKKEPAISKRRKVCSRSPVKKPQMSEVDIERVQKLQVIITNKQTREVPKKDSSPDSDIESVKENLKDSIQKFAAEKAEPESPDMDNLIGVFTRLTHLNLTPE